MRIPISEVDPVLTEQSLQAVLSSHSFRSSKQCQVLLRYIVEHTLANHDDLLRERMIGMSVFGRAPDYDTGNDPVVRSRVAEVRKRLAQYYLHDGSFNGCVRIDIPSGSYRASFEAPQKLTGGENQREYVAVAEISAKSPTNELAMSDSKVADIPLPTRRIARSTWKWVAGLSAIAVCSISVILLRPHRTPSEKAFDAFWAPILRCSRPVVVYIGANHSYGLSASFLNDYRARHHLKNTGVEFFIDLKRGETVDESDLVPFNRMIGFGDVAAASRIVSTLTRLGRSYDFRYGADIGVTDLRASPAFLIGGFSNSWTLRVMRDLRYTLEQGDRIIDHQHQDKVWIRSASPDGLKQDDYAVISRIPKSETGDFILAIAGIDTFSNQAAADLISDPDQIGTLMKNAPKGWENRTLQIILHTSVVNEIPVSIDIETVWSS